MTIEPREVLGLVSDADLLVEVRRRNLLGKPAADHLSGMFAAKRAVEEAKEAAFKAGFRAAGEYAKALEERISALEGYTS